MTETSGHTVTVDEVEAHLRALAQLMPKGPPDWANNELTFGQLRLLFILGQRGPVSIGQLAETLGVTAATASELVDRVERRGLVRRHHRADDRRVVECELGDEGTRLLAQITGARQQATRLMVAVLTQEELTDFDRLLGVMTERLSAANAGSRPAEATTNTSSVREATTTEIEPKQETAR
jgi:DNA-binding MarR family transcriptional regulator